MVNNTFVVASVYPCNEITKDHDVEAIHPDPLWRTTELGCRILQLLRNMYSFQVTYVKGYKLWDEFNSDYDSPPDIYVKPLPFTDVSEYVSPLYPVIKRRYGFTLLWPNKQLTVMEGFFTLPFAQDTWFYLLAMIFLVMTPLVFWLGKWEKIILKHQIGRKTQDYSLVYTILTVIGACCQHIPPFSPILGSRRVACLSLFAFTYVVHSYYTSNLLSHLVNDKNEDMSLEELVNSEYHFVVLDSIKLDSAKQLSWFYKQRNFLYKRLLRKKISERKTLDIVGALNALKNEKVAVLSDYITIYPYFREVLDNKEICDMVEVEVISNLFEYMYTSKLFPLREQFKVGMLRIIETGVLQRMKHMKLYSAPLCNFTPDLHIGIQHLIGPFTLMAMALVLAVGVMLAEIFYKRYWGVQLWPYLD